MIGTTRALAAGPALRRVPFAALAFAVAASAAITWTWALSDAGDSTFVMRIPAILIASAAAGCLEDRSESLTVTTAYGLRRRRLLAVVLTGLAAAVGWCVAVPGAAQVSARSLPVAQLFVEFAALCAVGWLLCAVLVAGLDVDGAGIRAAFGVGVSVAFSMAHPLLAEELWTIPHRGQAWPIVLLVALGVFVGLSRDGAAPAARWPRRFVNRTMTSPRQVQ